MVLPLAVSMGDPAGIGLELAKLFAADTILEEIGRRDEEEAVPPEDSPPA